MLVVQVNYVYDRALGPEALVERYETLSGWSEALAGAGAEAIVAQRYWRDATLERNGVRYLFRADGSEPAPRPWTWPRRLHRSVAGLGADLVHANGLGFATQVALLGRTLPRRTALVVQDHASPPPRLEGPLAGLRRAVLSLGLRRPDAFLFTAAEQAEPWRRAGLIRPTQAVHEVPESSRTIHRLPRREARGRSGIDGAPAVLWVGRLNANKDPLTVLSGFEKAAADLPGARLTLIYHDGELEAAVSARIAASPALSGRVRLRGRLPPGEMPAAYSAADVFVLGSHREGSGYALLEALACGCVPVVSDIPSFRALTAAGAVGALWPAGDADAFARRLVALANADLERLRAAAAAHFARALSWPAVGRRALAVYHEVRDRRLAAVA
jgi:glycosyltransferase involved in cell wall biosynthesis